MLFFEVGKHDSQDYWHEYASCERLDIHKFVWERLKTETLKDLECLKASFIDMADSFSETDRVNTT